jgi:hypothetical protein
LACWPPGPPLRLNRQRSSDAEITKVGDTRTRPGSSSTFQA